MTLTRWQRPDGILSPFRHLSTLREEIDRLFQSPMEELTRSSQQMLSGWLPALDLYEDENNFHVKAELPGLKKEEISISLHEGVLTLAGERLENDRFKKAEVYRAERFLGRFQRTLTLPSPVVAEKVKATYKDGILHVVLPKTEESKPRQITVNVA